ncbi:hypothetical protein A4A49_33789 [Nicotiana attenuata]|uniref:Uncharacterized protein n=1 Tax=Nicotiana attenuata TaxID=49451 RepID=A0A314KPD5_NICAT|nr:hypothetical protein A4A49_33789 [Nicotiana attenuata]
MLIKLLSYFANSLFFPFFACTLWSKWSLNLRLSQWSPIETQRYYHHLESLHAIFLRAPDSKKNKRNAWRRLWRLSLPLSFYLTFTCVI